MGLGSMSHNIYLTAVPDGVSLSVSVPAAPVARSARNITGAMESATEGGQVLRHRITDPHTAEPLGLHALDLTRSEQGVGDVLVVGEDRVVVSGHNCFGRPHALYGGSVPSD